MVKVAQIKLDGSVVFVEEDIPDVSVGMPYRISKTTPWLRMTPEEATIMDGVMEQTDAQLRQVYMAAQYLSSDDQFWQVLHKLLEDNLPGGTVRANELLAPEE